MNRLSGFIVHSLLSRYRSRIASNPLVFPFTIFISTSDVTSVLDDSYGTVHPWIRSTMWPISSLSFDKQVPRPSEPPIYRSSPILVYPHFFLIPVLESRTDNLDIQVKNWRLTLHVFVIPPRVPLSADNMEIQDNSDTLRPLAWTTLIFVISPFALYPPVHIGTIVVLS